MWLKDLNRDLKNHDKELYAQETKPGRVDVYRKNRNGFTPPHFIFSLTDNWNVSGKPVPWGIEVILNRIKAQDLWRDDTFVERWIKDHQDAEKAKDRASRNSIENFLYEFRGQFHKTFNDVNTSTMEKKYSKYAG